MSRLTVRLPASLHERLARQAEREGVSLSHYIVYTLTRTVTAADLESRRQTFEELTKRHPPGGGRSGTAGDPRGAPIARIRHEGS